MGFIRWLRGETARSQPQTPTERSVELEGDGDFPLQVIGESHYQAHLEAIAGRHEDGANFYSQARLILDDSNPYDRNAVRVEIDGLKVGHLSRPDAKAYRAFLAKRGLGRIVGTCEAHIRGGWDRGPTDRGHFGVWLDFTLYGR